MIVLEDRTHHLVAVVAVRVLTVIVLTEIAQAGTRTMIGISEIIIVVSVIAGIVITTGPGIQKKDEMTEGIAKVAGTGALAHIIGAGAGVEAGVGGAGAGAGAATRMSSGPVHSGMEIKRR